MKPRAVLVPAVLFVCSLAASAADPRLLGLAMPDAKVVSGFDVEQFKSSPLGQFFLARLPQPDSGFDKFVELTGFDPRRDIHEVLLASPGDPKQQAGLLLVKGDFDLARLTALLPGSVTTVDYKGVRIIIQQPAGRMPFSKAFAILDGSTAVAGDLDSVKGAIDRRESPSTLAPGLATQIGALSGAHDAWAISLVPPSALAGKVPDPNVNTALKGDLIKAIEQSSGGVRFGQNIAVDGEVTAQTEKDAGSLVDVAKFFLNLLQLNAPNKEAAALLALLHNLDVHAEGKAVKLSFTIPESDLENLIKLSSRVAAVR